MEKARLVFLGSSASTPTKNRGLSCAALKYMGEWLLFDVPEGTQRQMMHCNVSMLKIRYIFISHFHADHFLGLPGLLATMSIHQRDYPITIFGPRGVKERVDKILNAALMRLTFEVKAKEVRKGNVVEEENYRVRAFPLEHDVPCFGYAFKEKDKVGEFSRKNALALGIPEGHLWSRLQKGEVVEVNGKKFRPEQVIDASKAKKGKKISFVFDTKPSKNYFNEIKESDVLVHEATFSEKLTQRALETKHSTAKQAGMVAEQTRCKHLVLWHISARHKEEDKLENEARTEFNNVTVAKDFLELEV